MRHVWSASGPRNPFKPGFPANTATAILVVAYSISSKCAPIVTSPEKMDIGADLLLDRPHDEQGLRAQDADQRVSNAGGDDPDHLEAVGEESVSRTKYAFSWIASPLP